MFNREKEIKKEAVVYVFIDASNVWNAIKSMRKLIEYKNFKEYFKKYFDANKVEIFYYDAFPKEGTRDYDLGGKHRFFTYLKKGQGNMDVEITIDAIHNMQEYDIAVLFSGDADFLALVSYLRNSGKKVYIFSTEKNVSKELKTGGNGYFDLKNICEFWGKNLEYRTECQNKTTLN
ncbi:MAG: NYN domain-containing protein [Candidatus Gribaldobacteria bacterium]|nr:NYN domain-containing protein [Candidatus Gribaldobacteria bacterium]